MGAEMSDKEQDQVKDPKKDEDDDPRKGFGTEKQEKDWKPPSETREKP
jgi:hypothetical protein